MNFLKCKFQCCEPHKLHSIYFNIGMNLRDRCLKTWKPCWGFFLANKVANSCLLPNLRHRATTSHCRGLCPLNSGLSCVAHPFFLLSLLCRLFLVSSMFSFPSLFTAVIGRGMNCDNRNNALTASLSSALISLFCSIYRLLTPDLPVL